jgi:hypothetical protein
MNVHQFVCSLGFRWGSDQMSTVHLVVLFVSQNCFHSQMTKSTRHTSLIGLLGAILSLMVVSICRCAL